MLEAKLTHDTETFGKMDPFVIIKYREQEWRSAVCKSGGKNPKWLNQVMHLDAKYLGDDIFINVRDEDPMKSDSIGETKVKTSALVFNGGLEEWFELYFKGKPAGKLHLKCKWEPSAQHGVTVQPVGQPGMMVPPVMPPT